MEATALHTVHFVLFGHNYRQETPIQHTLLLLFINTGDFAIFVISVGSSSGESCQPNSNTMLMLGPHQGICEL